MSNEESRDLVNRRVRNLVIDYLALVSSARALLEYQRNVPIAHVYAELFEQWRDSVCLDVQSTDEVLPSPTYTDDERSAMVAFEHIWMEVSKDAPPNMALEEFLETALYSKLAAAARQTYEVLLKRGKLPAD